MWVSALASTSPEGKTTHRQLEVNWEVSEVLEGDWVGVFKDDPSQDWSSPMESIVPQGNVDHHLSNETLPILPVNTKMAEGACLGYWAAYMRSDVLVAIDCVKVHPRWLLTLKNELSQIAVRDLVLPGVHDAGTYTPYSPITENSLMKYAITQDESIYTTLVYGQRYIDLRAGYLEGEPEEPYWVVHGLTVWRPLREVLEQLRAFVQDTGELVVVEVGGFTFFETEAQHAGCIALIVEELGHVMAPASLGWDVSLGQFLQSSATIIVTYNHYLADGHPLFWPSVGGRWANAQSLEALEDYMVNVFEVEGPPATPWCLGGQLTPLAEDVITDDMDGLRTMADQVNRNVTQWLWHRWWDQLSIISCDFVLSAGYIDVAIETNLRRLP